MAVTKYLDSTGVGILWNKTKAYADARKKEITDAKGVANGFASLDANGNVPLSQLGNIDTTLLIIPADNKLPTTGIQTNKIYLIKENSETNNVYTEYVYVNNAWEILGKFAVKVDLSPYATTSAMNTALAGKVDKVSGKGLSTNDFTTTLLNKLNGIADGATKVSVDSALSDTSTNPVQNKIVKAAIDAKVDKVSGKGLSSNDFSDDYRGTLDRISMEMASSLSISNLDGINFSVPNEEQSSAEYEVTLRQKQMTFGDYTYDLPQDNGKIALTKQIPDISGKVDKVSGKGLSTNDYTTDEKNKLGGIETGANKTVVDNALNTNSANPVQNKVIAVNLLTMNTTLNNKANSSDVTTALAAKLNSADIAAITEEELNTLLV